jgi:hypothetical protein
METSCILQGDSGRKISIFGGDSIWYCEEEVNINLFRAKPECTLQLVCEDYVLFF